MVKVITLTLEDVDFLKSQSDDKNVGMGGLLIKIPGSIGSEADADATPIYIEYYEGKLRVLIWNDTQDPAITELKLNEEYKKVYDTPLKDLPLLINVQNEDAKELLNQRLIAGK